MKAVIHSGLVAIAMLAATSALAAEAGAWKTIQPGVVERVNADGSTSRAGSGRDGAEYVYRRFKAIIADLEAQPYSDENAQALRKAYAALGTAAALRNAPFHPASTDVDRVAPQKAGFGVKSVPDYVERVCEFYNAGFWSSYSSNATTATINAQTEYPRPTGFGPPPPPPTLPWTSISYSAFQTSSGGPWSADNQQVFGPSGPTIVASTKSASRVGYCNGYSIGEVSASCSASVNDYAFYEQWYTGCP
ncbi:MAG TPA: hypothetical protein VJ724_12920 [Tahibacter sp.]|nr:hypothetical protein [Tahibacter sp.]